ncbi:hypothetical protein LguiB_001371 [Lonicera macranthoides]
MDEQEFRRILDLFPIVRSPHYHLKEWQNAWGEGDKRDIQIEGIDEHVSQFVDKIANQVNRVLYYRCILEETKVGGGEEVGVVTVALVCQTISIYPYRQALKQTVCLGTSPKVTVFHGKCFREYAWRQKTVGAAKAEEFCQAFQRVHKKLVYEELSLDAARSFIKSSKGYHHPS